MRAINFAKCGHNDGRRPILRGSRVLVVSFRFVAAQRRSLNAEHLIKTIVELIGGQQVVRAGKAARRRERHKVNDGLRSGD